MYLKARSYASSSFPPGLPDYRRSEASDAHSDLRVANQKSKLNPRARCTRTARSKTVLPIEYRDDARLSASFRVAPACCSDVVCYGSFLAYGLNQGDRQSRCQAAAL